MIDFSPTYQTILTIMGFIGIGGIVIIGIRGRNTDQTIKDLKESNSALLEWKRDVAEPEIASLKHEVANLKQENDVLKKIPLEKIMQHLEQIVATQNKILASLPLAGTVVNVDKK